MPKLTRAKVLNNSETAKGIYRLVIAEPELAKTANPGQFLNLRVTETTAPLLRRPISVHWTAGETLEMLYQVVGPGTRLLSQLQPGAILDVQGPLGRGFWIGSAGKMLLVGGGIGIAPLGLLARELDPDKTLCLLGARTGEVLLASGGKRLMDLGFTCKLATDDGSAGIQGVVTDLLEQELSGTATVYACGPRPMLSAAAELAISRDIPCQVSLEEHMGCGVGACLGCVCKVSRPGRDNYLKVCSDGPVFDAREVVWQ